MQTCNDIFEKISSYLDKDAVWNDKIQAVYDFLGAAWATTTECANVTPFVHEIFTVSNASNIPLDFGTRFHPLSFELDAADVITFQQKVSCDLAVPVEFQPDAFFSLVNPVWVKQIKILRAKEKDHVAKEDYESAISVASALSSLEEVTPEHLTKLLHEQGPRLDLIANCDALVVAVVGADPEDSMELDRAYKRMRTS